MSSTASLTIFRQCIATICCLFGLPGNILTIFVCLKSFYQRTINFERRVFDLYLIEISILDTFVLLYWVIETIISYLYSIDQINFFSLMHLSPFSCFFSHILNRLCAALSSWLITFFTLIRFLNIFRQFNTIKSNLIILFSLILIFSIANSYSVIALEYDTNTSIVINENVSIPQTFCQIRSKYANDRLTLLLNTFVAGILNLALPSILNLIVNIAILLYVKRIYNYQRERKLSRHGDTNLYRSTRSTVLVISITYTLCYLPYCIFYLLMITMEDRNDTLHYVSEITYILRHVSHSVNFYAYIFTNNRFRRDILSFVRFSSRARCLRREKKTGIIVEIHRLPPPPPPPPPDRCRLLLNNRNTNK